MKSYILTGLIFFVSFIKGEGKRSFPDLRRRSLYSGSISVESKNKKDIISPVQDYGDIDIRELSGSGSGSGSGDGNKNNGDNNQNKDNGNKQYAYAYSANSSSSSSWYAISHPGRNLIFGLIAGCVGLSAIGVAIVFLKKTKKDDFDSDNQIVVTKPNLRLPRPKRSSGKNSIGYESAELGNIYYESDYAARNIPVNTRTSSHREYIDYQGQQHVGRPRMYSRSPSNSQREFMDREGRSQRDHLYHEHGTRYSSRSRSRNHSDRNNMSNHGQYDERGRPRDSSRMGSGRRMDHGYYVQQE